MTNLAQQGNLSGVSFEALFALLIYSFMSSSTGKALTIGFLSEFEFLKSELTRICGK